MVYGTESFKLVRSDSPDTSFEAAEAVDTTYLEELVHKTISSFGSNGCISDDVRSILPSHLPYSSVTARYKGLYEKGYIKYTGEKRPGKSGRKQRVMVTAV